MVSDTYKLALTMNIMKKQREQLVSDFSVCLDYRMMEGLQRFEYPAEYNIYVELYHVLWIDKHWNKLLEGLERDVPLKEDRMNLERYFSSCFLELTESFKMMNDSYTPVFFEILHAKIASLRDMIDISQKCDQRSAELAYAQTKHNKEYQAMLEKYKK